MFNLEEEQKILAKLSDYNSLKSKKNFLKGKKEVILIHASALTTATINNNLEKANEVHDKLYCKSLHEAAKHYSR